MSVPPPTERLSPLPHTPIPVAHLLVSPPLDPLPLVPGYTLVREIGRGGMGAVYEADQHDPPRRVAVKLIARDALDAEAAARFAVERQAIARMDHPHVARVYDAGVTAAGVPFFAMELVHGPALTTYCRGRGLTLRERLALFADVCRAVQHAHQKGVIHRDLKPGNILVAEAGGRPVPKVIDFGVAKLASGVGAGAGVTRHGLIAGTPLYMAPEQAEPFVHVDTRADVFALGVILFELLTGRTPLDPAELDDLPTMLMLNKVGAQTAPRPSEVAPPADAAVLRGELDWVVLRCLRADPDERYQTADQLADDIGRYLRHEPVTARPPSGWYAARKFVRRHRGPVAAAAVMLALLVAGVVGTSAGLVQATEQRRIADEQRVLAEARATAEAEARTREADARRQADTENMAAKAVLGFVLSELIAPVDPWARVPGHTGPNADVTLATVLDRAAAGVDARFPDHPEIRSRLREMLGRAYFTLDRFAEAEAQVTRWKEDADRRLPPGAPERGRADGLLALVYAESGRADRAEPLFREAVRVAAAEHGADSAEARQAREELANGLSRGGKRDEAAGLLADLLATADRPADRLRVAVNLAAVYLDAGQLTKVIPLLAEYAEAKADGETYEATARLHLGTAYQGLGELDKARPLFEGVYQAFGERLGPNHLRTLEAGGKLAAVHTATGRHAAAAKLYADIIPRLKKEYGPTHPHLIEWLGNLGIIHATADRKTQAEEVRRERVEVCRKVFGADSPHTADAEYDLIFSLGAVGKWEEADPIARHCLAVFEKTAPDLWFTAHTRLFMAILLDQQGKTAELERQLLLAAEWAIADHPKGPPPTPHQINATVGTLVGFYSVQGNRAAERKWRAEWAKRVRETLPPPRPAK
jgi:tetratricopeptide (TPR) repeat protein